MLGLCRGHPYRLLNVCTVTFVQYILHHNGAVCCRFLNTEEPFKTFSHVWCKNNPIPKFFHVINIHFCPSDVCSLIHLVWAHCAQGWKVLFEHLLMCMQIPSLFCHLRTCMLQAEHHISTAHLYMLCILSCTGTTLRILLFYFNCKRKLLGIISVTCSAIAVQLEVCCSDWPTGQKITTANPSSYVTRPWSTC